MMCVCMCVCVLRVCAHAAQKGMCAVYSNGVSRVH